MNANKIIPEDVVAVHNFEQFIPKHKRIARPITDERLDPDAR